MNSRTALPKITPPSHEGRKFRLTCFSMVTGKPIPTKPFTLRWNMNRCSPLGLESVALSGQVELLVFQTDNGLGAIVTPDGLRVDSHAGSGWLQGPFAAETSLAAPAAKASERTRHAS